MTRQIMVGKVPIGGGAPVSIQSMLNTRTTDVQGSLDQIRRLHAAGCQIVLFTTGRGTPFGTFVPTAKISTNSTLAATKPLWIDFNAGEIVDGTPVEEVDQAFIDFVIGVASGERTNNEKSGYSEIAIFKSGVTL